METGTRWIRPIGALAMASSLTLGAGPALAQDSTPAAGMEIDLTSAPVDMHEGTCASPTLDPWDEIGRLQRQAFGDVPAVDDGLTDQDVAVAPGTVFVTEDLNDDGILDDGEDLDGDGILDFGIDADEDGVLDDGEALADGEVVFGVINLPDVWTTHGVIDAPFDPIFSQPNVIAVHQSSEQYETIVACGNLGGIEFEDAGDEVVVGLTPVDGSGIRGYAVFTYDTIIFGEDQTVVDVYLFDRLPTTRDTTMVVDATS